MAFKKNILLVDDDSFAHLLGERVLASLGIAKTIYKALNGKEALKILTDYCEGLISIPDLIILDLHMPIMNGFEFMTAFNRMDCIDRNKVTVVVFTASINSQEIADIKSLGVNYCLPKPITAESIRSVIAGTNQFSIL